MAVVLLCWGSRFVVLRWSVCCVAAVVKSSDSVRNPIGRRTESDWAANGIRSDGGRNPTIVSKLFRDFPTSV